MTTPEDDATNTANTTNTHDSITSTNTHDRPNSNGTTSGNSAATNTTSDNNTDEGVDTVSHVRYPAPQQTLTAEHVAEQVAKELGMTPGELRAGVGEEVKANPQAMFDRMNAGLLYHADDPMIQEVSRHGKSVAQRLSRLDITDEEGRAAGFKEILGTYAHSATIMPPMTVDYGHNIHIGHGTFINFESMFLDICPIVIGNNCQIGPRAQFLAALHPMENHELRAAGWEYGAPITLGDNVWFGGGVTVCAGVTIGENSVIGAGSVVTRDIPANSFAAGVPAKVIREL